MLFASCTLTKAQQNYAQLHREALAIVFAVKKFHKYIFGKSFVIYSDHQPLKEIFNENKSMPIANGRLQRWAIFLSMYSYHIEYKKGSKLGNADALSRLPLKTENDIEPENVHAFAEKIPLDMTQVSEHTQRCKVLKEVFERLMNGWHNTVSAVLKPFHDKKLMLSVENKCIFYGNRIVIPDALKIDILNLLHDTHIGVCRMKASARQYVWWPTIDTDIEDFARHCNECQAMQTTPSKTPLSKWNETKTFFERIHMDFFHLNNKTFLLVVDAYSRWFDVKLMTTTTSEKVINELRIIFAYFGLPKTIVSDNGPPFGSKEFLKFCSNNSITCLKSPPYHPQSNGWAECGVRTVKQSLRKMLLESKKNANMQLLLSRFLIKYRNTPVTTTGLTPNERIFCFRPTILMDALISRAQPSHAKIATTETTAKPKQSSPAKQNLINTKATVKTATKTYLQNEIVLYRNIANNEVKWLKAKIICVLSKYRYRIELTTRGSRRDCHGEQLRPYNNNEFFKLPTAHENKEDTDVEFIPSRASQHRKRDNIRTAMDRSSRHRGKPRQNYYESTYRKKNKRKRTTNTEN